MWTLLRLNPQLQAKYCEYVQGTWPELEVYYPKYRRISRPSGKRYPITLVLPVYPGYVFANVAMHKTHIHGLISAPIKAYFIRLKALPDDIRTISTIPESVIVKLKHLEARNELMVESVQQSPYQPGRRIVVKHPSFDLLAIIVKIRGTHVIADTNIGRVDVPIHTIELM